MKLAVIKIGARVSFGKIDTNGNKAITKDTSGGNGEAKAIIDILKRGGNDVTVLTKVIKNDYLPEDYTFIDILEEFKHDQSFSKINEGWDALVVVNGNFNCFGGAEESIALDIANYAFINNFKNDVFYCLCDPALVLTSNIYNSIKSKPWASKYSEKLNITRDDIKVITQPFNTKAIAEKFNSTKNAINVLESNVFHFPFEKFPLLCESNFISPVSLDREYDLLYGGTMRSNRRKKKMAKFYYGYDPSKLKVEMFGKIDGEVLSKEAEKQGKKFGPTISGPVNYSLFCKKMSSSIAHVVIGDPLYEESSDVPQRLYESLAANVVTFIDNDLDKEKRVFKSSELSKGEFDELVDFLYVKDSSEVSEKLISLKNDRGLLEHILELQQKVLDGFSPRAYSAELTSLIESYKECGPAKVELKLESKKVQSVVDEVEALF